MRQSYSSNPRKWLAHACCHPECDHIEIDGSCNHAGYLCYASEVHAPGAVPLRPVYVVFAEEQPTGAEARQLREDTNYAEWYDGSPLSRWRRPSQHFERTPEGELLTEPLSDDEDWPGWPEMAHLQHQDGR